jgi:CO dehydrogenase/acetyl-CoA synthase gamma subunit (corrinoid Fe-S protein)
MTSANLYLNRLDLKRYLNMDLCGACGFSSCEKFVEAVGRDERKCEDCFFIDRNIAYSVEAVKKIEEIWPDVPVLAYPRPAFTGLVELNQPDDRSLVLVSGNNEFTEQVLLTVLSTTICPFYLLFVDTDGNTVDMSMIYKSISAERIQRALISTGIEDKNVVKELIVPGLASSLKHEIEAITGWNVRVGPVCAAELPLFLSDIWLPP